MNHLNSTSENNETNKTSFLKILAKFIIFLIIFYGLTAVTAFILKDDTNSYSRVLIHEFHEQENIDYLICGASHVSHGLNPELADKMLNKNIFNTGTPSQPLNSTYAIIKQALSIHKIEKVFVELDFATAGISDPRKNSSSKSSYIASGFIKDPGQKFEFLLNSTSPSYYLNSLLPIGKDKLLTLEPAKIINKIKAVCTGEYFKYEYHDGDSDYAKKGCVLDNAIIKNGTFTETIIETPIKVPYTNEVWKHYVSSIIKLCREKNAELIFFEMPDSDFYLNEKGNYDEYYSYVKDFVSSYGYEFYSFNLAKPDFYNPVDEDYFDDNHLNRYGIEKYTKSFCKLFSQKKINKSDFFYDSYKEKLDAQDDKIFGLVLITDKENAEINIHPITNHVSPEKITFDWAIFDFNKNILTTVLNSNSSKIVLPPQANGSVLIKAYVNGVLNNEVSSSFVTF